MLTDDELRAIAERRVDAAGENSAWNEDERSRYRVSTALEDIDRLLAEIRELRLLLRDAVQDATPGNRLWREGVKAGLEAAAKVAQEAKESEMVQTAERATAWYACDMIRGLIRAIGPASILP